MSFRIYQVILAVLVLSFLLLMGAGCSGASAHLQRGDELAQADLHEEALAEYQKAAKLDPENQEAKAGIAAMRRSLASAANEDGQTLLASKDHIGAIGAFKRAVRFDPENAGYRKNLSKAALEYLAGGRKLLEKGELEKAISVFEKLLKELPKDPEAKQALEETRIMRSKQLFEEAEQHMERRLFGNALIQLVKINKMIGMYRNSAAMEAEARGEMQSAARYGIDVLPGKAKKKYTEPTAKLVQSVRRIKVENCPTVELPAEAEPRLTVRPAVIDLKFEQTQETTTGEQKYQSGIRKVDNPKYLELKKKITESRLRIAELEDLLKKDVTIIEQARQAFADAGPSDDEESLRGKLKGSEKNQTNHKTELIRRENEVVEFRSTLSKTPRKLDEPVFDMHTYDVFKVTRTAQVTVEVVARGEGGVKLLKESFDASASTTDTTNPAIRRYKVKADPLQFPKTDSELVESTLEEFAKKIGSKTSGLCGIWQKEILSRARQASTAATIEATEDYVLYVFVAPGDPPAEVKHFLKEQFDFEDIKALRGD